VGSKDVPPLNLGTAMEIDRDQISPISGKSSNSSPTSVYSSTDPKDATSFITPLITEANPAQSLLQFIQNTQPQFQDQMMIMPAEPRITTPTHQTEPQSSEIVLRRQNAIENLDEPEYMVFVNHLFYIILLTSCRMVSTLKRRYPLGSTRRTA